MSDPEDPINIESCLLSVGSVGGPHGRAGEVRVVLTTNLVQERTEPGSEFYIARDDEPITLVVLESARPHKGKWLFKFEGVDTPERASKLGGDLKAAPITVPGRIMLHDLIGLPVHDAEGVKLGEVAAIVANPVNDLLELDHGGLIPINCIVGNSNDRIDVTIPNGLLD